MRAPGGRGDSHTWWLVIRTARALRVLYDGGMETETNRRADAFELLVSVCPVPAPLRLTNRELAISAMSAALGSEDADLVDRVADALRWVGQDWLLR